jgi:hypothetical protein
VTIANKKSPRRKAVEQGIVNENLEIQEAIRLKAYEIYLERNGAAGDPLEDWIMAEKIVLKRLLRFARNDT